MKKDQLNIKVGKRLERVKIRMRVDSPITPFIGVLQNNKAVLSKKIKAIEKELRSIEMATHY